jgi:hypothetical protein
MLRGKNFANLAFSRPTAENVVTKTAVTARRAKCF